MRIADKMQFNQVRDNVGKNRAELSGLQNQAATQKRVVKPSDDPSAASRVLLNRTEVQGDEQFIKNINVAKSYLDYSDQSLAEVSEMLVRAKELALGQANDGGSTPTSRRVVATEINQLYQQAVQVGNRKLGERFLFGGYKTTETPFDYEGNYRGDTGEIMIQVNKDAYLSTNVPGSRIFLGEGISKDGIGRINDQVPLTIKQLDEMRAREHKQAELKAEHESDPQPVRGPSSVGRGSSSPGPSRENHELSELGSDPRFQGLNIFHVLRDLEVGLETDHKPSIQESIDQLDDALAQVVLTRSQIGSRLMALDNNLSTLQRGTVDAKSAISQLEDADAFTLVSDISKNQSTLQATLATSGKLIQPSLLDFLK